MSQCKIETNKVNRSSDNLTEIQFLLKSLRSIVILALLDKGALTKKQISIEIKTVFRAELALPIIDELLDDLWFDGIIYHEGTGVKTKYLHTGKIKKSG